MEFKPGDIVKVDMVGRVVQLKSGGPLMCVQDFRPGAGPISVLCVWFDGGVAKEGWFLIDCLIIPDWYKLDGTELGKSS